MKRIVLIVEDNEEQRSMLEHLVLEVEPEATVYTAGELGTAYRILMERTVDVLMVDIVLDTNKPGDASGIRLVEKIRQVPRYMFTPVVFVTMLEDSTKYAFTDLNCLGYVEKPFSPERVKQLVSKALSFPRKSESDHVFCFRKDGILYPVKIKEIVYIESVNHEIEVYMANGSTLTIPYKPFRQLLEEIDADCLLQCSRNTIINKDYVESVDVTNKYIAMRGCTKRIEIGITFKKKILAEYGL